MAHPSPTAQHFSEMMMLANKLNNDKLIKQCKVTTIFTLHTTKGVFNFINYFNPTGGHGKMRRDQ